MVTHWLEKYAAQVPITTRWADNDIYGHINNVTYYSFFDTAVNSLLVSSGVLDPAKGGQIGLVVETGCRYARALAFPVDLIAGVRVAHVGNSSVRYEVAIGTETDPVAAAEGFFVHVYVDRETRRPTPLSSALRATVTNWIIEKTE